MIIYDNIHGYIKVDAIASNIIDTPVFQRLRNIHQTGVLYLVYPTSNHSRFEHSIGTYHLAKQMITNISIKQPELNITDEIILLVSIAGLCHDLGHLLFSHLFDDNFLPRLSNYNELSEKTPNVHHENRSIVLLNYLVDKYKINLNKHQLKVIADLIYPKKAEYNKWKPNYMVGKWIFQIISNPINSIDVDKFDYLIRDTKAVGLKFSFDYSRLINDAKVITSNNKQNICYSMQCSEDIYHMFFLRYRLHRQIYNDKAVKAIEILILKLLFEIEKEYNISNYILDPEKMIKLDDMFIWRYNMSQGSFENTLINNIFEQLNTRQIPQLVFQDISLNRIEIDEVKLKEKFNSSSFEIIRFMVGYIGGKSNPLNHITFYDLNTNTIIPQKKVRDFSLLLNQKHQEHFLRVYCTDLTLLEDFKNYFDILNYESSDNVE